MCRAETIFGSTAWEEIKRNDLTALGQLQEYVAKKIAIYISGNRADTGGGNTTATDDWIHLLARRPLSSVLPWWPDPRQSLLYERLDLAVRLFM